MAESRKYSDDQVRAILDRALATSAAADGLSHEDLLGIGEQVGVSRDAMARAASALHEEQQQGDAQRAIGSRRRRWLGYHAALFALVNALAFTVNFLTTPGEWWSLFLIVPWALFLVLHAGLNSALPISDAAVTRERQRRTAKRTSTTQRLRVEAPAVPNAASELEAGEQDAAGPTSKAART